MTSRLQNAAASVAEPGEDAGMQKAVRRLRSADLFKQAREVEIEHHGRIYRLRLTQLNKLILTA
ncbi:MAG TPA: hemin uptake protein HemP [Noviherbaspirillum sp.]